MSRFVFKLPDVGEGIAEAEVVAWHVGVGDMVEEDAPLVDVMTDKATVEITSPVRGKVLSLSTQPGGMAAVGAPLVELETESEEADEMAEAVETVRDVEPDGAPAAVYPAPMEADEEIEAEGSRADEQAAEAPPRPAVPLAAPAVRRRAAALGIDLGEIRGSGPGGQVVHADLDALVARQAPRPVAGARREDVRQVKVIGLRRRIAEKMAESKRRIPHFGYVEEVDITELEDLRRHLNETYPDRPRLTLLPFLAAALVRALPDFPQVNARYDDEAGVVEQFAAVHLGLATQTDAGLVVPVIRHAETLDLWACAAEITRLAAAVRAGTAARDELSGSTITVTSLGPLGGVSHFPVINHPEVTILGPNRMAERPVVRGGQIVARRMMNLSSAFDHRVVDGYDAASFIQRLKGLLEHPGALFVS